MRKNTNVKFNLLPMVVAISVAYNSAYAETSTEVMDLITPESFVSMGISSVNNAQDATRFSQYTGFNKGASVLFDAAINKRNDETGFWTRFNVRNLGLDTRELSFSQSKPADWKYTLDYNEIVRLDPYVINTGMTGIGSTAPTVNLIARPAMPAAWATANGLVASNGIPGSDVSLKMKRTALGVSGDKWITPELQVELSFRNEDKKGARLFGRGAMASNDNVFIATRGTGAANGGWAVLLTPEPISSTTRMFEGKLNFTRDQLSVSAGYFGSFYNNNNDSLSTIFNGTALNRGVLWNGVVGGQSVLSQVSSSVALAPDNQAHQFYVSGNYAFSNTTRSNFKLAYTRATQNQAFAGVGLMPTNPALTSLNGQVDTTLAQFGLAMKPVKDLSVNASFRYEDRADKTPLNVYNYGTTLIALRAAPSAALNGTTNWNSGSQTRTTAKLDGVYRLPSGYSVALGGDWERKATPLPPSNVAIVQNQMFFRTTLNEYGIHAEVRKNMSDSLNGAIGLEYKQRRGNEWWTTNALVGNALTTLTAAGALVTSTNTVLPDMYMDRNRTKLRGNLDWEANEKLSVQAVVEHTQDDYKRPPMAPVVQLIPTIPGARTIISDSVSLDSTYQVSEDWRVNGFWTYSFNRWNVNKANLGDDTRNTDNTFGFGVNGKATSRLTLGLDLLATKDVTTFNNLPSAGNLAVTAATILATGQTLPGNYLPNINYKTNKLNLRANYEVDKISSIQGIFSYQQFKTDDWQWGYNGTPFLFSDNTTVSQPMNQKLKFLGVNYLLKL